MSILTWANLVTSIRLFVIAPVAIIFLKNDKIAFSLVMALFFLLDFVDGYLARKLNQCTAFGGFLDGFTDTAGIFVLLAFFLETSTLTFLECIIIVFPRLAHYAITECIHLVKGKLIVTHIWKMTITIWVVLFAYILLIGNDNIGYLIIIALIYLMTLAHFIIELKFLSDKKKNIFIKEVLNRNLSSERTK